MVVAILVQQQSGGNLAELLDKLAVVVRDRFRMRDRIRTLTAESKFQAVLLMVMPPLMFVVLLVVKRSYVDGAFSSIPGCWWSSSPCSFLGQCGFTGSPISGIDRGSSAMTFILFSSGAVFLATTVLLWLFFSWNDKDENRLDDRLEQLANPTANLRARQTAARPRHGVSALPKLTKPFLPSGEKPRTRLQNRLLYAGYYQPRSHHLVSCRQNAAAVLALGACRGAEHVGNRPLVMELGAAALFGLLGLVGPGLWLNKKKEQRQITFRAAMPDVLDVLVICLEAGASLPSALLRVTEELRLAHPELGLELAIIEREMQLGRSLGKAFMHFADRSDLDEVRSLAGCMNQTDRLGGGLVKTLRIQAKAMRERRLQYAEEKAQKAGTKILFPTLLLIFPAIFVILVGPAAFQVYTLMHKARP